MIVKIARCCALMLAMYHCGGVYVEKKFSKGTQETDFKTLTASPLFVDKTMLTKALLDLPLYQYITYPHGFGKTVNLDMLRRFFQFSIDNTTKKEVENRETTEDYKLFTNPQLNLTITQDVDFIERHLKAHPVMYLNFDHIRGKTYLEVVDGIREEIRKLFQQYDCLYDYLEKKANSTDKYDKYLGDRYFFLFSKCLKGHAEEHDLIGSLDVLSEMINRYFSRRAILLVDGFDRPMMNAIDFGFDFGDVHFFVQSLFSPMFRGNYRAGFALLTGVSRLLTASASSYINLQAFSFTDQHKYAEYFGFTDDEVTKLCDKRGIEEEERVKMKEFYNGYFVANGSIRLYNPTDILHYLEHRTLSKSHIFSNVDEQLSKLMSYPNIRQKMIITLSRQELKCCVEVNVTIKELGSYISFVQRKKSDKFYDGLKFTCTYLFENGYLVHENGNIDSSRFKIPNERVASHLKKCLQDFYSIFGVNLTQPLLRDKLTCIFGTNETNEVLKISLRGQLEDAVRPLIKCKTVGEVKIAMNDFEFRTVVYCVLLFNFDNIRFKRKARKLNKDGESEKIIEVDAILVSSNEEVQLMIQIEFHQTADCALRYILNCVPIEIDDKLKVIKYMGVHLKPDNTLTIEEDTPRLL